ncbi:inositol-tetrakisphosphate 1-kinase isoform X2 [Bombina bombina]|nr:inositol-tetrakisphosphate 1-kinase isoform X2 [Bombina bombina]
MQDERLCSPPFMELMTEASDDTIKLIEKNGLAFPFICKTRVAHGTNSHEMAIIFNPEGLQAIKPPCVIQSFISHNAVLYKVFVVGESYTVVERPSLKNFSQGSSDRESIFFNSHNVSKPESSSVLTALDKVEGVFERPSDDVIRGISKALRQALGISLFGIDIIINNKTGQHAVIDINAFPGYEGVPEFFNDLLNHITTILQRPEQNANKPQTEQTGTMLTDRLCCAPAARKDPWIVENEPNGAVKLQSQRLGCNTAVSPSFQQHCVSTLATKASSQ